MNLTLRRSYGPNETEGTLFLHSPLLPFYTIEQPWQANTEYPAGIPYKSCIPEGTYNLVPYERGNGQKVWAMVNESLGVFFSKAETGEPWHRFKCLIHPGNVVAHTQGCLLPGNKRGVLKGKRAVLESGFRPNYALDIITKELGEMSEGHTLTIS